MNRVKIVNVVLGLSKGKTISFIYLEKVCNVIAQIVLDLGNSNIRLILFLLSRSFKK